MGPIEIALLVVQIIVAAVLCGLILLQHGKGADMGAAFGSGSSGSLFGASGSANFLSRTTAVLAAVFFATSLGLTYTGSLRVQPKDPAQQGVMQSLPTPKASDVPQSSVAPAPAVPAKNDVPTKGDVPAKSEAGTAPPAKSGEVPK
jgi:preprotein translocase subunit SecG